MGKVGLQRTVEPRLGLCHLRGHHDAHAGEAHLGKDGGQTLDQRLGDQVGGDRLLDEWMVAGNALGQRLEREQCGGLIDDEQHGPGAHGGGKVVDFLDIVAFE